MPVFHINTQGGYLLSSVIIVNVHTHMLTHAYHMLRQNYVFVPVGNLRNLPA